MKLITIVLYILELILKYDLMPVLGVLIYSLLISSCHTLLSQLSLPFPKLPIRQVPSLVSVMSFSLSAFQLFLFFITIIIYFISLLGHKAAKSLRLFLKDEWKVTEQSKAPISCPAAAVWGGLHCYSKTAGLEVPQGQQDLRQNLLSLSHLWWLLVQLWALIIPSVSQRELSLDVKGFLWALQCLLMSWFSKEPRAHLHLGYGQGTFSLNAMSKDMFLVFWVAKYNFTWSTGLCRKYFISPHLFNLYLSC